MKSKSRGLDARGVTNVLLIPLILAVVLLVGAAIFGVWAFQSREDYRLRTDDKIAAAVKVAVQDEDLKKDQEHAEADKQPLKPYKGPEQDGSVQIYYPKTWSGYVSTSDDSSGTPLDGYLHPGVVPSLDDDNSAFATRFSLVGESYADAVKDLDSQVADKKVTAAPYAFPKVPNVVGMRFDGAINPDKPNITGVMVMVPLRDKTLEVWTESPVYTSDFNTFILPNLSFSP